MDKNAFPKILLDSGAYTAFRKGIEIDIDEYAEFVRTWSHFFFHQFNLDVINDAEASYNNWDYLRKQGIYTIPVWHMGTAEKWLELYLEETDYIAIGAIANLNTGKRRTSLQDVWNRLLLRNGVPHHKVHGLGLTQMGIVSMFPWYSVDSFTPVISAVWGSILIPSIVNGKVDYTKEFGIYKVSDQGVHDSTMENSYLTYPKSNKPTLEAEFEKAGFKLGNPYYQEVRQRRTIKNRIPEGRPEGFWDLTVPPDVEDTLCNSWTERMRWNLLVWDRVIRRLPTNEYHVGKEIFQAKPIVFTGVSGNTHCRVMGEAHGDFDVLVSYAYYNKAETLEVIEEYKHDKTKNDG